MKSTQTTEQLQEIQKQSEQQERPEQKAVVSVSEKIRKRVHNLPDPKNAPLGYDDHKVFDRVFPYVNIPSLHPSNNDDTVIFNDPNAEPNKLYLGDNLEVLRTLKTESIDLIYIDPPFFSGRNYNVIWGDSNEVRTFGDIWEGGINSYLIWLNARLWEMRRVLKKTGSIYVHCDWHASHYIKTEMDKIFGYENFQNEIVWGYETYQGNVKKYFARKHDIIFLYKKGEKYTFHQSHLDDHEESINYERWKNYIVDGDKIMGDNYPKTDSRFMQRLNKWIRVNKRQPRPDDVIFEIKSFAVSSFWKDIKPVDPKDKSERIGYPTQKPEALLERIIKASSNEGDVVADFFCGGGTTLAVAMKNNCQFVGCDSSRVAVSVTLDRLVKIGEDISKVKSNLSVKDGESFQLGLQMQGATEKVSNIEVNYLGIYPIEKFKGLSQDDFIGFVLVAYGASRNSASGVTHGYKAPAQQEPILVGPADPAKSPEASEIKEFFDEVKAKLEPNKLVRPKIIAWRFSRKVLEYIKILQKYCFDNNLPVELEAMPLDSKDFRKRILQRMPDIEEAELFLRFSKPPAIGEIKVTKLIDLEYWFEAIDAFSTNEDGWLVNCQWDFDYQEGHFAADKNYILSREKKRDPKRGEIFEAVLTAKYTFGKAGEYTIACKVQDNLAGETILSKKVKI